MIFKIEFDSTLVHFICRKSLWKHFIRLSLFTFVFPWLLLHKNQYTTVLHKNAWVIHLCTVSSSTDFSAALELVDNKQHFYYFFHEERWLLLKYMHYKNCYKYLCIAKKPFFSRFMFHYHLQSSRKEVMNCNRWSCF